MQQKSCSIFIMMINTTIQLLQFEFWSSILALPRKHPHCTEWSPVTYQGKVSAESTHSSNRQDQERRIIILALQKGIWCSQISQLLQATVPVGHSHGGRAGLQRATLPPPSKQGTFHQQQQCTHSPSLSTFSWTSSCQKKTEKLVVKSVGVTVHS